MCLQGKVVSHSLVAFPLLAMLVGFGARGWGRSGECPSCPEAARESPRSSIRFGEGCT